jgi:hypothetical protein
LKEKIQTMSKQWEEFEEKYLSEHQMCLEKIREIQLVVEKNIDLKKFPSLEEEGRRQLELSLHDEELELNR